MIRPVVGATTVVAGPVIATASTVVIEPMMLVANVTDGIVTAVTGLSDSGNGDCPHSDD
jgi:hypothetical protein